MPITQATVFLIEDDERIRRPLSIVVRSAGFQTVEFESAERFLENYAGEPGCIVLDVRLSGPMSGLELQDELVNRGVMIPIIFTSAFGDVPMAVQAMQSGARDFLTKPFDDEQLIDRIRAAVETDTTTASHRKQISRGLSQLSPRELEVMKLLVAPMELKQIARRLEISPKTVEKHRANLLMKMQADSVVELLCRLRSCDRHLNRMLFEKSPAMAGN